MGFIGKDGRHFVVREISGVLRAKHLRDTVAVGCVCMCVCISDSTSAVAAKTVLLELELKKAAAARTDLTGRAVRGTVESKARRGITEAGVSGV